MAKDLAEEIAEILRVVIRIAGGAAVTDGDVEVAIGAKVDVAAVVVDERSSAIWKSTRMVSGSARSGLSAETVYSASVSAPLSE